MERKALFAGSFDPFTIGHMDIVARASGLFDKIVIGIGINPDKKPWMPVQQRVEAIREAIAKNQGICAAGIEVATFEGLASDYARRIGARYLLRGVRTVADFEYERTLADANRLISGSEPLETVLILARPEMSVVSSSLVRELARFGASYSRFLP